MVDFNYNFYDFENQNEMEEITEEEMQRLEELQKEMAQIESQLTFALRALKDTDERRLEVKKLMLRGNDLKAFIILKHRLLDTGFMSRSDFLMEIFRRGMQSMMDQDRGNALYAAVTASVLARIHPELGKRINIKMVRDGLKQYEKTRKEALMDAMMEESFDVKEQH